MSSPAAILKSPLGSPQLDIKLNTGYTVHHVFYAEYSTFLKSPLSPKFKRVSLNETPEFPFWGLNICVDFDLRDSKKMENINQVKKIIFYYKNIDIHKTA